MVEYLMGVDLGTGGCKVSLIDTEGNFISEGYSEYPSYHPHAGWVEQKPRDWIAAFKGALQRAVETKNVALSRIAGLSVDASAHNMVLLNHDGEIIRDTIMWQDQRAAAEVVFLKTHYLPLIQNTTFATPSATWSLPQLLWIRKHEPEAFQRIDKIMFIDDVCIYYMLYSHIF